MLNIKLTEEDIELIAQVTISYNELPFDSKSYDVCKLLQLLNDKVYLANYLEPIKGKQLSNKQLDKLPPKTDDMFNILDNFKQGSREYLDLKSN